MEQKIGQMLLTGFRGLTVDAQSPVAADIAAGRIGGVILFDKDVALGTSERNIQSPQQVKALIASLQSYAPTILLVAVDQEGGKVARLKPDYGFPASVSQQYLGTLDNTDSTHYYGLQTATTLKQAGFNVDFAPVVDLNINPDNPVIGKIERSFSADPDIVIKHASIIIDELRSQGILATLKHFPGHGSSTGDSHAGFVDVTETWKSIELQPFAQLIMQGKVAIVMTAHIYNSKLDPKYPATLSKAIITDLLRKSMGYSGVVVSDDMNMKAITDIYGLEEAIELAINAGVDILVLANNLVYDENIAQKAQAIILKLIDDGKIPRSRIDESYSRIIKLKELLYKGYL